jgi:hypothetical protein
MGLVWFGLLGEGGKFAFSNLRVIYLERPLGLADANDTDVTYHCALQDLGSSSIKPWGDRRL